MGGEPMTPQQRATLDAMGSGTWTAARLAFDLGISESATRGRLDRLYRDGWIDRRWHFGRLVWWVHR